MEINKLNEVNPDDLDVIFRGIQLFIDQKENDLETTISQLVDKYKYYQLQDHDKKVSELIEKCKNQNAINYVLSIRDILNYKAQNFAVILNKVHKRCEMQANQQNEDNPQIQMKRSVPSWQLNSQQNRTLFQFYDIDFWKLYDIMLLNKQYCSNLIVYHQSKNENVERLFVSSLERNQRFLQSKTLPLMEITILADKAKKLKFLQLTSTMETPYANKNITMFGNQSPTKKTQISVKHSMSISPQRTQSRDPQDQDIRSMFDTETCNLFDNNYRVTRAKNLSLHNDKNVGGCSTQLKQKGKSKLQQENFSPQKGCKNQNWMLPEIKSPFSQDQNVIHTNQQDSLIKPIQIYQNYAFTQSPDRRSAKKPPLGQDLNSTLCQQLLPQYRSNNRAFQTIKSFIRK
ncbi:unnamed protein product [Paramecium pentaurelia]|uniref:Uncharacterized protein n=1 Tax=Paramecium pentaurelia TaxID=43138 RepID=A0A8S1WQR9_9CILI|nr:unnamed protein product [Paramecium pentaurelia]